jgi:hypothetical protein
MKEDRATEKWERSERPDRGRAVFRSRVASPSLLVSTASLLYTMVPRSRNPILSHSSSESSLLATSSQRIRRSRYVPRISFVEFEIHISLVDARRYLDRPELL